jgi:hypothetical protein
MASTYINDLRLNEMATGDASGTWGTTTNTNLELIAEAFSYGTEAITTNADTHTTTIADGATDPGRALYLKYTGTLDSACTITIGPNTVSKVWIVENGTSGSQNIILSQGSGANITIPAGDTKVVYSDGAGAGAAFVDAFASLSVVDLKVQDDLTVTGDITGTLATAAQPNITSLGTIASLVATTADINGGTIDATVIGGATAAAVTGTTVVANTSVNIAGDGATVTGIKDEDNMASNSATKLATQQSIKAYVDAQVGTVDTLSEVLAIGNTTGATDIDVDGAQKVQFRDAAIYINSSVDGQLDIVADTEIQIAATTVDINGTVDVSGTVTATGTSVFASLDISGDIDVDGTTNLDVVDIDGAVNLGSTFTFGNAAYIIGNSTNGIRINKSDDSVNLFKFLDDGSFQTVTLGISNLRLGLNAGNSIVSGGNYNVVIGDEAGTAITTGDQNTAVGYSSLVANTTGGNNVALGGFALDANTTASNNTAVGYRCFRRKHHSRKQHCCWL